MKYFFRDVVLDADRRELRRGGVLQPIEPQAFDVLTFLLSHRDRVASKDELFEAIWKGRIVSIPTWPHGSTPLAQQSATTAKIKF